ncbi:Secretory component protein-like protein [Hapsidospora chrysogenum ATCC 11550]|uniref:Secretory component protein-like protein n=1 Tax=Hapsidospora chrysogenum (strain ATCC 11550 / CBS 779.69 / DSM 880 / IAM 14645 / JCM 23072 / IMI 49137) TaxID=857340 RepID=A0A086T6L6_HAPC1|nr:Secretory component protein-like protein [Hapsidospora chrysogenum ATCC 11550]
MSSMVDWSKTTKSANYYGSTSFATFMIIGRDYLLTCPTHPPATCFLLGLLFAALPYDFPLLWSKEPVSAAYFDQLETHLRFMHQSPPLISRVLNIVLATAFSGFAIKMYRPSEANLLFDGASAILYLIGVAVYTSNTIKGLRAVSEGVWNTDEWKTTREGRVQGEVILGREDSLKVLAASNTILALVLIGVLVLQAGQWYAEKKDREEPSPKKEKKGDSNKKKQ